MMKAPCARLTMFSTPQTRARPSAMMAYSPPSRMPLTRTCASRSTANPVVEIRLARVPGRHRVLGLRHEPLRVVDLDQMLALHLDHDLRQVDLAVRAERDRTVQALELDLGQ